MSRFDMPLIELARLADELSASADPATFRDRVVLHLGRLRAEARATTAHLVVRWGAREDQQLFIHGRSAGADVPAMADTLDRCPAWRQQIVPAALTPVHRSTAAPEVAEIMATHGVETCWIVAGPKSLPGTSHAVFGFAERPVLPASDEVTALSIRCTLLVSRAISRLELFEWDEIVSRTISDGRSFLFETDDSGDLVRWPFPIAGDPRLVSQIAPSDRGQVREVMLELLGGATGSYEMLVRRITGPHTSEPMRVLARRSPNGGMEGVVLPPGLPVAALPQAVADRLTSREREIVRLLAAGYRVKQVSEQLYLSINTVRNHLKNIFGKLGVASQPALIALVNDPHAAPQRSVSA
jgi:DNA-binding CsgD family transcriptional regulator